MQPLTPSDYFRKVTKPYSSLKAKSAKKDKGILSLCSHIILDRQKLLIDFGCGQGRLLAALKHTKSDKELVKLHYIGIDSDSVSLANCKSTFYKLNFTNGTRASFLTHDQFKLCNRYLADYVVMVFTIHELDFLNLDKYLAVLWQRLRRGGTLLIQDSYVPIFKEIEFICFLPQDIETVMLHCSPSVQIHSLTAGKHNVPLYTILLRKDENELPAAAYSLHNLTDSYLSVLSRSIVREAYTMYEMRKKIEGGGEIEIEEFAPLVHRIAVKAKAYHQLKSFDLFERGELNYCIFCGSKNIIIEEQLAAIEDDGFRNYKCQDCGRFQYTYLPNRRGQAFDEYDLSFLFHFLERGTKIFDETQSAYRRRLIIDFFNYNRDVMDTVEFLLYRIPGIDSGIIADAKTLAG